MAYKIREIKILENFVFIATFNNGIKKKYDVKQLFEIFPQFTDFEKITGLFQRVQIDTGGYGISWNDYLDLEADEIWDNGIEVGKNPDIDILSLLASKLSETREVIGMTQKQLSDTTGIHQADISKIERGIGNPSLSTLKRLADGMGMNLKIDFIPKKTARF